jgi:predicted transcriptional regulator
VTPSDTLDLAAKLVTSFVSNNSLPTGELPALIQIIHAALMRLKDRAETPAPEEQKPVVSIRQSITPEYLICLEDGKHFKSLKRHLAGHGLTPEEYRAKWKLPSDYPMVPANYAAVRSELAKKIGLGEIRRGAGTRKRGRTPKPPG